MNDLNNDIGHILTQIKRDFVMNDCMSIPYGHKKKLHTFDVDPYNNIEICVPKSVNFLDVFRWTDKIDDNIYTKLLIEYKEGDAFDDLITINCHTGSYAEIQPHECYIGSVVEFGIIKSFYVS